MKSSFKIVGSLFILLICSQSIAQKTYITRKGFMVIKAFEGDSLLSYRFNNIVVLLDYDKATVDLNFKFNDSLDDIVPTNGFLSDHDARITTRLSIPKIETQPHPDWSFHTKGELSYNGKTYDMKGDGELKHHHGSERMSCYLMLRLEVMEGSELIMEPIGKVHELHLFQTVLSQKTLNEAERNGN